jgi:glycosyltransferase involved in cell wall biosynthesis
MRIVIDMQGAQTESRFRGIGRYTMSFTKAVVANRGEHEIILALSGLFPETVEPIRAAFYDLLPQENIRVWYAPGPICESQPDNKSRRETAEILREAFLSSLEPDIIHICSLFEGYIDDAVTSINRFDTDTPVSMILYDLIPLLNPKAYLDQNPLYKQYYMQKIQYCRQAALCLAISNFSAKEAIEALNFKKDQIINISAAIDPQFSQISIEESAKTQLYSKFGIHLPFILYTGGADERKNLPRLIEAYANLPTKLRDSHQLLITGRIDSWTLKQLKRSVQSVRLNPSKVIFTGYISEKELVLLYSLCKVYVLPSWHEGCGLPVLEAMACGAPVVGANNSSLPEFINFPDALFNPFSSTSISQKIAQVLQDETLRTQLHEHGIEQSRKFSWNEIAIKTIQAWETINQNRSTTLPVSRSKPSLAFISPFPPEETGIADYSADLIPTLAKYYEITIIVIQDRLNEICANNNSLNIQGVEWFRENSKMFDRVLYQTGNSQFHQHMISLIEEIPGIVVLHDFYIGHLMQWMELVAQISHAFTINLYESHGYNSVKSRYLNATVALEKYPSNGHFLQYAQGVIIHSAYSQNLLQKWYPSFPTQSSKVVPMPIAESRYSFSKVEARKELGFAEQDYVVCSFGFLGLTKLNHRLLDCWLKSPLSQNKSCHLVFVGKNNDDDYGRELLQKIHNHDQKNSIHITGFVDVSTFSQYLALADVAVQLRSMSRGETSAAVLRCMSHGLPVIVNAHATLAELDADSVWMLPDEFNDNDLIYALEKLWYSSADRHQLGRKACQKVLEFHSPNICSELYSESIEYFYRYPSRTLPTIIHETAKKQDKFSYKTETLRLATALSRNHPLPKLSKRLYLDVTATRYYDLKTGIQRVTRAITLALLEFPPDSYRIEPVYLNLEHGVWVYRHARKYTLSLMQCPIDGLEDEVVEPEMGDILLQLDLSGDIPIRAEYTGLFRDYRARGVLVYATVFDLLPVLLPHVFPPGANEAHHQWLQMISKFDGAVCISKSVANDLCAWQANQKIEWDQRRPYHVAWFHLGSDIFNSAPTQGLPDNSEAVLAKLKSHITFLMVGTVEPRKAYMQVLDAFDALWEDGEDVNLVIVGHEGWEHIPDDTRRDIPQTVKRLKRHPKLNNYLFWLKGISDEYLEQVYAASTCLIAASYGEGFGLPLIEAARHRLPIIARDIPIFREVAGNSAYYFQASKSGDLKLAIKQWIKNFQLNSIPQSNNIIHQSWQQSAYQLLNALIDTNAK